MASRSGKGQGVAQPSAEWLHIDDIGGARIALRITEHRGSDDLLSAGLGLAGLSGELPMPQSLAEIDPVLLRRRAIYSNWRGIASLGRGDAVQRALDAPVPGRELHARVQLPGMAQPSRFLLQLPDHFDPRRPRLLVTSSSGSRGIYGAIALAGGWGLPRGWAVAYTDRGAGTDWFDVDTRTAPGLDGMLTENPAEQLFAPGPSEWAGLPPKSILTKHAFGGHHAETRWGDFVEHARGMAWQVLQRLFDGLARRRVSVAVGLSNGGGAVLRVLEKPHGFDGIVALAPNVHAPGGRAFPRYAVEAAAWMPLAQLAPQLDDAPSPVPRAVIEAHAEAARETLQQAGWLRPGGSLAAEARQAYRWLRRRGWPRQTLAAARVTTAFDFWASAMPTYLAAAGRLSALELAGPDLLGCHFAAAPELKSDGGDLPGLRRMLRWSDSAGIVPGFDAAIEHGLASAARTVRMAELVRGQGGWGTRVRRGLDATCVGPIRAPCPTTVIHGRADGLIPSVFSSEPWVRAVRGSLPRLRVHWLDRTPHFDAFLGIPGYGDRLEPLLPHGYAALDTMAPELAR